MSATTDWEKLKANSKEMESSLDPAFRRFNGCYFTDLDLAKDMIDNVFDSFEEHQIRNIRLMKFLEPCVGTGNFVLAYLEKIKELHLETEIVRKIIDNIYVSDISEDLLEFYRNALADYVHDTFGIVLDSDYFIEHTHRGLLYNINSSAMDYVGIEDAFPGVGPFDIIVTNPPYKNLKAERDQFVDEEDYETTKKHYSELKRSASDHLQYSINGILNIYKLFVEEIVEKYAASGSVISLLIPNTILSDKSCKRLRKRIIDTCKIIRIEIIREDSSYVDAQQALCTLLLKKGCENSTFLINKDYCADKSNLAEISIRDVTAIEDCPIIAVNDSEYEFLKQLRKFPQLSSYKYIHNLRGELDLTQFREYISTDRTEFKLLRGKHISKYFINEADAQYAQPSFMDVCTKSQYVARPRIACQQISNMLSDERINYAYIPENHILGNSCNFISVDRNQDSIDLYYLLGLLNSSIINWYFKISSSNNHVNNYEIDSFPIPNNPEYSKLISKKVQEYLASKESALLAEIDNLVKAVYDIAPRGPPMQMTFDDLTIRMCSELKMMLPSVTEDDCAAILSGKTDIKTILSTHPHNLSEVDYRASSALCEKYVRLSKDVVLNHCSFKLSDLDLEMIKNVPQGGNWKDIPAGTVSKSKRLMQITQSGGRTTLYGRIDPDKPSYTISTYFSRPGNGTFVHPIHNRTITPREAARFQSFKDDYYFTGSKGKVSKQIGNAVPPLMAMQIAQKIIQETGLTATIGLFSGAGGLTVGFKEAGMKSVLETDFDIDACVTCKVNNPEIPVLCADITDESTKRAIIDCAFENEVDIICGGPPCQGFSMAGKRFVDDPRNQLFKHYAEVVRGVAPKIIVFENVEGLLSMSNGQTYSEIINLFGSLGYKIAGRVLNSVNYGVPQKRKRVIVIGVRNDISVNPESLFPEESTPLESDWITASDAISDLSDVPCNDESHYVGSADLSLYEKEMRSLEPFGNHIRAR